MKSINHRAVVEREQFLAPTVGRAGEQVLLLSIILGGTALRVHQLGARGFWGDEIWTAQRSNWTVQQIIDFSLDNTIGPWTYLAGRAALSLLGTGVQEYVLRWPSVLASVLAILVVWALAHRLWGRTAGLAAAALVAVSPYQVWYAQEARYYAWLVLLATLSFYFLFRAFQQPQRIGLWAGFSVATILNIYNHPLSALLVVASQLPFCLIYGFRSRGRVIGLAASCAAIGIASLPLIMRTLAVGAVNNQDPSSLMTPNMEDWLRALIDIQLLLIGRFGAGGWWQWLFLSCVLLGVVALAQAKQWPALVLLALPLLVAPLFFAVWKYPFILRYVLFLQPLYLLLAVRGGLALADLATTLAARRRAPHQRSPRRVPWNHLRGALAAGFLLLLLIPSLITTSRAYTQSKVIDWRSLAAYLQTHAQPHDAVASPLVWAGAALSWYLDPAARYPLFNTTDPDSEALLSGTKRIWLIQPIEQPLDPHDPRNPLAALDLVPDDGWKDPRLDYEVDFYPVSELPVRLYVGETAASWIRFAGVPEPDWTDRPYSEIAPGDKLHFSLSMPDAAPRELWVTYFDYPDKELQVRLDGQVLGVIGGVGGGWQTTPLPVPGDIGAVVEVTIEAVGGGIGGVSFAELRSTAP